MKYTGRVTGLIIMFTAIIIIRLYAYIYLDYPLTAPPIMGVISLFIAFKAGKQYDKVKFLSEKDNLTKCCNRRFVNNIFPTLLAQMNKRNEKLSLAILDCVKALPEMMKNIEEALGNTDFKELSKISHQLKGTSGSLKIKEIFELARTLETSALTKDKNDCELTYLEMKKLSSAK